VVWDATNLRRDFRSIISTLSQNYHALVILIVFIAPEDTIYKNNRERAYPVPDDVLKSQIMRYQIPLLCEAHQMCVVDQAGDIVYESGRYSPFRTESKVTDQLDRV